MELSAVERILQSLEHEGVRYAVFGGMALNLLGLARFTEDLDLFLLADAANVEALKRALRAVFADPSLEQITAEDLLGDYPAVQYNPPDGTFHVDILTRLGEAFRFEDLEVIRVPLGELTVSVASPRTLIRMKRDTVRAKDRADAEMLRQQFDIEDE